MRKKFLASLLLLCSSAIFAQKELPAFGKIDKADLLLKECEFDKDAEAYKLISYGDVHYTIKGTDFNIESTKRVRIKILKDKGIHLADIKLDFYSQANYENIRDISAVTYNLDNAGNIVISKVEKSSIYTKKINKEISQIAFTMPDVKVGSVIEFKYTRVKKSESNLGDWYFQDDIPTRISIYRILIPSLFRFTTQLFAYQNVEQKNDDVNEHAMYGNNSISYNSVEKTYILKNVPALRDEPYMGAQKDYLQRVIFQLSQIDYGGGDILEVRSTWGKLTHDLLENEYFGQQLRKNLPHTKSLDDALKNVQGDYNKMVMIHDYVRKNMTWNGNESIYSDDGIKSAWDKKTGNNAELNFVLINLLKDAGLQAFPLLVSTKDNGSVNTLYPFLEQFNNTMTCVFIDDKTYILNAADKYNPAYLVPYDVVNNEGFIVDVTRGGWITLTDKNDMWKNVVSIFAEVTPDASMKGEATVSSYGYCKNPRVKKWEEDKPSFKDYFDKDYTGIKIDSISVNNENNDTMPLEQKVDFSFPLNSSGEYKYFTLNLFQGLEKNPFIADQRQTDIEFNYKQSYIVVGNIAIPDNYEFEDLPKNVIMRMPDSSIVLKRLMQADNGSLNIRITLDFLQPYYTADTYPLLQEFYKKLFATLNEQVVIKKKKVNP